MAYFVEHDRVSGSGLYIYAVAGEDLGDRKLVYLDAGGTWSLADVDAAATMSVVGLTMDVIASGTTGWILLKGFIGLSTWTWTAGGTLYATFTPGELSQTAPALIRQTIGRATTTTQIYFNPQNPETGSAMGCILLPGSTAYVGFDPCKEPFTNYFYCDGVADNVQINAAEAYVTSLGGGTVELERGTFSLVAPIIPTGDQIWYKGQSMDTLLDGDGLATTEHLFHITGDNEIKITDMKMQTQGGGDKTCHCIFIEDGADDFHIEHIIIDDSDDNGIHIEGTDIVRGHIHGCHVVSTDGHGIYVNMDDGETMEQLHITDTDIIDVGGTGIYFDASAGNNYSRVEGNGIINPAGNGIYVDDGEQMQIIGNLITSAGLNGIQIVGSSDMNIADNICTTNVRHGIYLTGSTDDSLIDGNICNDNDSGDTATYDGINIDGSACTNNTIINNTCLRNHGNGIYTVGIANQINTNLVAENDKHGIQFSGGDCQVSSNHVADNSQDEAGTFHGIHVLGSGDRAIIIGNHIDGRGDSQGDGIQLSNGATEVTITGNHCQDGMGNGITLSAANDDCLIMGNFLLENDSYGIEISAGTCDNNDVLNNTFVGNVTAPVLNSGTGTKFQTKQYYVARDDENVGVVPGKSITIGQTAYIAVHAPEGTQQIMGFNIYVIPNATKVAADWDLETDYGAIGEAYNTHEEAENAATYNVVNDQWFAVDAWGAGMFASMVSEDTGGIGLTVGTAGDNVTVVMAELYYV